MKKLLAAGLLLSCLGTSAQQVRMSPELLWKLGRVTAVGLTKDKTGVVYKVATPNVAEDKIPKKTYVVSLKTGEAKPWTDTTIETNSRVSPNGKYKLTAQEVKVKKVFGTDLYADLPKSTAHIYNELNYRHWDEWEDGAYSHVFLHNLVKGKADKGKDIMAGQPYDCPLKPHGGQEDYIWSPDSKSVIYVTKPLSGLAYAQSTNTDIFQYDVATGKLTNLSAGNMGYDVAPAFSPSGQLAWLSMKTDGNESDKNDIVVNNGMGIVNLTQHWDGTVNSFKWSEDGRKIFFNAPVGGTIQLFEVDYTGATMKVPEVKQITNGQFDVSGLVGQVGNQMVVTRTDMNHAAELYTVDLPSGSMKQLSHVNDAIYKTVEMGKVEKRMVTTTDNQQMTVWVVYPPGFDPAKKYPTLLYCQGGPQSALTQTYSFRWNFQLMAANGYIVVAPNRRGMPGHGVKLNADISKDEGGRVVDE